MRFLPVAYNKTIKNDKDNISKNAADNNNQEITKSDTKKTLRSKSEPPKIISAKAELKT